MRVIPGAPGGVVADPPRREVGAQVSGEVPGGAIVGSDDQRRALSEATIVLQQGRDQQRPQGRGGMNGDGIIALTDVSSRGGERIDTLVFEREVDQGAKGQGRRS